jgi:hypothetical protein
MGKQPGSREGATCLVLKNELSLPCDTESVHFTLVLDQHLTTATKEFLETC